MLALLLSSLVMSSTFRLLPPLYRQLSTLRQQRLLRAEMHYALWSIGLRLQRAGYCAGPCAGEAIRTDRFPGETAQSCLLLAQDQHAEAGGQPYTAYFGFRLRNQMLEAQAAVTDCRQKGWQRLFDPDVWVITRFQAQPHNHYWLIVLEGRARRGDGRTLVLQLAVVPLNN